jgi:hypothetical protein
VSNVWLREGRSDAGPLNPDLESFLAAGEPPIYIGFGSIVGPDPAHLGAVVSNAVQQAGVRAVIASGWGALRGVQSNSNTIAIEGAPHGSLFPRVAAVVHHGGAGTTAAGLLAARLTVVCPFQGDQYFGGPRFTALGQGRSQCPSRSSLPTDLCRRSGRSAVTPACELVPPCGRSGSLKKTVPAWLANRSKALWPSRSAAFRFIDGSNRPATQRPIRSRTLLVVSEARLVVRKEDLGNKITPGAHASFREYVPQMPLHGVHRDHQSVSDVGR